jgi:hypothetical protein
MFEPIFTEFVKYFTIVYVLLLINFQFLHRNENIWNNNAASDTT